VICWFEGWLPPDDWVYATPPRGVGKRVARGAAILVDRGISAKLEFERRLAETNLRITQIKKELDRLTLVGVLPSIRESSPFVTRDTTILLNGGRD
jgi:hypothetical protein